MGVPFEVNISSRGLSQHIMKEIDDTDPTESESEAPEWFLIWIATYFSERMNSIEGRIDENGERIDRLLIRIANLETQRTPQDENDDPDWY